MLLTAQTPYPVVAVLTFAAGFGMAFAMPAPTSAAVASPPSERVGIVGGVINAARQTGSVVGVAVLGAMVVGRDSLPGFHTAVVIAAGVLAAGAALVSATLLDSRTRAASSDSART